MDTEDLEFCGECGVYFNIYTVKKTEGVYGNTTYICPLCKHENNK